MQFSCLVSIWTVSSPVRNICWYLLSFRMWRMIYVFSTCSSGCYICLMYTKDVPCHISNKFHPLCISLTCLCMQYKLQVPEDFIGSHLNKSSLPRPLTLNCLMEFLDLKPLPSTVHVFPCNILALFHQHYSFINCIPEALLCLIHLHEAHLFMCIHYLVID